MRMSFHFQTFSYVQFGLSNYYRVNRMSFLITVQPSSTQFACEADETILAAAIRAGVGLPYGCKNGACGSCKGKILDGAVAHKPHQARALTDQEKLQGMSLFCCAVPGRRPGPGSSRSTARG